MSKIMERFKENKIFNILIAIVCLFIVMIAFWIKKSTFSAENTSVDGLTLACPTSATAGDEIECLIYANVVDKTILSINANYVMDDGITYNSFSLDDSCTSDCLSSYAISENGFAVGKIDGIASNTLVGALKVNISNDAVPRSNYNIELKDIEYSDSEYQMVSLENVSTAVRINSDDAVLENIILDGYSLNEEFDSTVFEYTATVSGLTDELVISYTKPADSNPVVSILDSVDEKVSLHYGRNVINIEVTSESGKVTNNYVVSINRNYEFETEAYEYNKELNYIYTKNDSNEAIIDGLEELEDGLSYDIVEDNKLFILYDKEVLDIIDILRFTSEYEIIDGEICITNIDDLTYGGIIARIKSDSLDIRIVDANDVEVTDNETVIDENESYKMEILYNGEKIDTYIFDYYYITFDESLVIDENKKIIKKVSAGTTWDYLNLLIDAGGRIDWISYDGSEFNSEDLVRTGDKIAINLGDRTITYTISVLGDVSGDGMIEINDVSRLYRYFNNRIEHLNIEYSNDFDDEAFIAAGDVVVDGMIGIEDVSRLYRYYNDTVDILEVIR